MRWFPLAYILHLGIGRLLPVPPDSSRFFCIPQRASRQSLALIQVIESVNGLRIWNVTWRNPLLPGNTPLHLAMESAHAQAAVLLIEAGADRGRVRASCHLTQSLLTEDV